MHRLIQFLDALQLSASLKDGVVVEPMSVEWMLPGEVDDSLEQMPAMSIYKCKLAAKPFPSLFHLLLFLKFVVVALI